MAFDPSNSVDMTGMSVRESVSKKQPHPMKLFDRASQLAKSASVASMQAFTPKVMNPVDPFGITQKAGTAIMKTPDPLIEQGATALGGMVGGIPGAGAGQMVGKAVTMAKQDTGAPLTKQASINAGKKLLTAGATGAGEALAFKGAAKVVGGVAKPIARIFSNKAAKQAATDFQTSAFKYKAAAGERISGDIARIESTNPTKRLPSMRGPVETLAEEIKANPSLRASIESGQKRADTDLLTKLLDGKLDPDDLTISQGQQLKAAIDRIPAIATKLQKGKFADFSPAEIPLLDFKDEVRSAQLAFSDEAADAFKEYSNAMNLYRQVRPKLRPGSFAHGGVPRLGEDPFVKDAYKQVVPKKLRREASATTFTKRALTAGGALVGADALGKFFRGH